MRILQGLYFFGEAVVIFFGSAVAAFGLMYALGIGGRIFGF